MPTFNFPDSDPKILQDVQKINGNYEENILLNELNLDLSVKNSSIKKSQLSVYLEDTLDYMQENNLIPELPEVMYAY